MRKWLKPAIVSVASVACGSTALLAGWYWLNFGPPLPVSRSDYHIKGHFGSVQDWPVIPIHAVVLPDHRVMTYGTDQRGRQGAELVYDVWNPAQGFGSDAHLILPNKVGTDLFCVGQVVLAQPDGKVLLAGGDARQRGERNWSSADINFFNPTSNALEHAPEKLVAARWYPAVLTLPNGDVIVAGGRTGKELYSPDVDLYDLAKKTWRTVPKAASETAFGATNWNYPRMWVDPRGDVALLHVSGDLFKLDAKNDWAISKVGRLTERWGHPYLPSVMYRPGKILSLRYSHWLDIDLNGEKPVATELPVTLSLRRSSRAG